MREVKDQNQEAPRSSILMMFVVSKMILSRIREAFKTTIGLLEWRVLATGEELLVLRVRVRGFSGLWCTPMLITFEI